MIEAVRPITTNTRHVLCEQCGKLADEARRCLEADGDKSNSNMIDGPHTGSASRRPY